MNELIIGVLCAVGVGWMGWVSITIVRNYNNSSDVAELKKAFNDMKEDVKDAIDKVNERQDKFMQTEIQELKNLISK